MYKQQSKYVPQMNDALQEWKQLPQEQQTHDRKMETVEEITALIKKTRKDNLKKRFAYTRERFLTSLVSSIIIGLTTCAIMLLVLTALVSPESYVLYHEFSEWEGCGAEFCPEQTPSGILDEIRNAIEAFTSITEGFFASAIVVVQEEGQPAQTAGNIAGLARIGIVISVIVSVFVNFRHMLEARYILNEQHAQLADYSSMPKFTRLGVQICLVIASAFGTYVIVSIAWLALSQVFKPEFEQSYIYLNYFPAVAVIFCSIVFVCTITSYLALAITTRELLALGLSIFVIGLGVSATLADPLMQTDGTIYQWWHHAVSSLGKGMASAPLFTATLVSVAMILIAVWFDIDSLIRQMLVRANGDNERTQVYKNPIKNWLSKKSVDSKMRVAAALYMSVVIGFMLVGLVRTTHFAITPINWLLHTGGAFVPILCVVALSVLVPAAQKDWFDSWYLNFSTYIVPAIGLIAFGLQYAGWINLTMLELILFGMVAAWLYMTIENLTVQANYRFQPGETGELKARIEKILAGDYDENWLIDATNRPTARPMLPPDPVQVLDH